MNIKMETITLKRTLKGTWLKRYDDYEESFTRISKKEAINDITLAREKGVMFADDDETKENEILIFGYAN